MDITDLDKIKQIAYSLKDIQSRDSMHEIMKFCLKTIQDGDVENINNLFKDFNIDELSAITCSVFLRSLFAYRNAITEWEPFRQRVLISMEQRQIPNWKDKFIGLIDIHDKPSPWANDFDRLLNVHPSLQRQS